MRARIHLCGRLEVEWEGERLEDALPGRQGRLLFAYLTLHRARPVRRDELLEALWPAGAAGPADDALLRPPLSRLRRALGEGRLEGRAELTLRLPDPTWIDWDWTREALRESRGHYAAGHYAEGWEPARRALAVADRGLLPGLEAAWLDPFRADLEERRAELLETVALLGAHLGGAELPEAETAARKAVEAAPFRESARVALLDVLRRRGNVAEALVAFDDFRTLVREELGSAPGPQLLAMHEELLRAERPAPAATRLPDRLTQALGEPWVGREAAIGRFSELARDAKAGRTGVVLLTGEGGIGKTRLIAETAARLDGFDVLYGRCDEEELFPYGPWVDMLGDRLDDAARQAAHAGGDPDAERRELFAAVADIVREHARRRPLLLVLDDLHWADRSSILLARHLARDATLGRVLIVGTFRDSELGPGHPLPELIADVERDREVSRIRLGGMDHNEVCALVTACHCGEVECRTVRAIRAETDGNPFFVKQLLRHLQEQDGPVDLDAPLGVPEGLRDVIARRVARLPGDAGHVLRVAALIGRDFDYELLERVAGLCEDDLLDVLDAAVRGALLAEVPSTPGRYSFTHALLRTTLGSELSATRRARLHRRIGEAIEALHGGDLEPWLGELARHFAEAGPAETERAVGYAVRAAVHARSRLAHEEAMRLLAGAVALRRRAAPAEPAGLAELADLEIALAAAEADAGHPDASRATYARAAETARRAGADAAFARAALGHAGGTWEQYGRADPASVALLRTAFDRLGPAHTALRARLLARRAVLLYYIDAREGRSLATACEAVAIARRCGDADALVAALIAEQYARWRPGRAHERLAIAGELIELTERRGPSAELAEAYLWRALALLELCRLDEADADLARHGEIAEQTRQHSLLIHRCALTSMRALLEGDYERGLAAAEDVVALGELNNGPKRSPTPTHLQYYGAEMIQVLGERGEMGALAPYFERLVREIGELPGWRTPLAWAYVQSGRHDEARREIDALSADGFAMLPRDTNFLPSLAILAHAIAELGDAELAARVEPLLAPFAGSWVVLGPGPATLGPVAYSAGLLQLLLDRAQDAASSFELALELSERMRARPYVARSRAGLAEALRRRARPGDGPRADALSARAAAGAREVGMPRLERELALSPA